jgi:hypothetical protein
MLMGGIRIIADVVDKVNKNRGQRQIEFVDIGGG